MGQKVNLNTLGQEQIFSMMGEDTENIGRNYDGDSPVKKANPTNSPQPVSSKEGKKGVSYNMSDKRYDDLSFNTTL